MLGQAIPFFSGTVWSRAFIKNEGFFAFCAVANRSQKQLKKQSYFRMVHFIRAIEEARRLLKGKHRVTFNLTVTKNKI